MRHSNTLGAAGLPPPRNPSSLPLSSLGKPSLALRAPCYNTPLAHLTPPPPKTSACRPLHRFVFAFLPSACQPPHTPPPPQRAGGDAGPQLAPSSAPPPPSLAKGEVISAPASAPAPSIADGARAWQRLSTLAALPLPPPQPYIREHQHRTHTAAIGARSTVSPLAPRPAPARSDLTGV
jgi:hypothetical protein